MRPFLAALLAAISFAPAAVAQYPRVAAVENGLQPSVRIRGHPRAMQRDCLRFEGHRPAPHLVERQLTNEDAVVMALSATQPSTCRVSTPGEHRTL